MFKNFREKIEMNFQKLSSAKPSNVDNTSRFNIDFLNLVNDDVVNSIDKEKLDFYKQMVNQISKNSEDFKKVIYEYNLVKMDREKLNDAIEKIVKQYKKIYSITDAEILKNPELYKIKMENIKTKEGKMLNEVVSNTLESYGITKTNELFQKGGAGNETLLEIQNRLKGEKLKYVKNIEDLRKNHDDNMILSKYIDRLDGAMTGDMLSSDYVRAQKVKDVIDDMEDEDNIYSIQKLQISKEDKLVFIGLTFLIRLLCLSLIDWALKTNFIVSFTDAFLLYVFLYTIFILLIVVIVNISYSMPLSEVYSSDSTILSKLASTLYYFYLIPGARFESAGKIIFHLGLLFFVTIVSIIIKQTDGNKDSTDKNSKVRYDYSFKRDINNTLNTFTLMSWIFLSMLAIM